jgi:hypothetical protein
MSSIVSASFTQAPGGNPGATASTSALGEAASTVATGTGVDPLGMGAVPGCVAVGAGYAPLGVPASPLPCCGVATAAGLPPGASPGPLAILPPQAPAPKVVAKAAKAHTGNVFRSNSMVIPHRARLDVPGGVRACVLCTG